jgi:hypothetical protein
VNLVHVSLNDTPISITVIFFFKIQGKQTKGKKEIKKGGKERKEGNKIKINES